MKKKVLFLVLCACSLALTSQAQLTTGNPTSRKIMTGNRPAEGDFGIYFGATSDMFKSLGDGNISMKAMPLINLKYMYRDQIELRLGLEFWKKTSTEKGETYTEPATNEEEKTEEGVDFKNRTIESRNYIYPGIAYHFSKHNLLDVYVGAELPIGWERYKVSNEYDKAEGSVSRGTFNVGLGAFIGLQAFIANLPLAIGAEYGISSMFHGRLRYKHTESDGETSQTYYTKDLSEAIKYNSLKVKQGEIGSQFRVTLTYYFK